ncbi:MAG: DUF2029 domain-containing protein [bacterium]|nr:DUF2029 domain-containing protein [bacterium]
MNSPSNRRNLRFWVVMTILGVVLRLLLILLSPRWGYLFDHDDAVRWGIQAADHGSLSLYEEPPPHWDIRCWHAGQWVITQRPDQRGFHYPPLTAHLLHASGLAHLALSPDRTVNTITSRLVFSVWGMAGEILLAWGCAALVRAYGSARGARWTYGLVLLVPPFWLDTCYWGQFDAALLAASVGAVWALLRRRWMLAGVLLGVAAALKPQALLVMPVWLIAVVGGPQRFRAALSIGWAALVLLLCALPHTLHGGWTWWWISYPQTLSAEFPATTLNAFNLWYADLLCCDSLDVSATWFGVAKETWGRGLAFAGLAGGAGWILRRWRRDPRGLVLMALWVPLISVMVAPRVHERYLLLVVPFLVVLTMWWRRFLPSLVLLLVVATCQMTWPLWIGTPAGTWPNHVEAETQRHIAAQEIGEVALSGAADGFDRGLAVRRAAYLEGRAGTKPIEWGVTLIALLGAALAAGATLSVTPPPREGRDGPRQSA